MNPKLTDEERREKKRLLRKKYYATHKEKLGLYRKIYDSTRKSEKRAKWREYYKANEHLQTKSRKENLTPEQIEKRKLRCKNYNQRNKESQTRNRNVRNLLLKIQVLRKYGGKCLGCECKELACLSLDHINDGGHKLRAQGIDKFGYPFYRRLLRDPRRSDLQILCMNCQFRKRKYGSYIPGWPLHPNNLDIDSEIF